MDRMAQLGSMSWKNSRGLHDKIDMPHPYLGTKASAQTAPNTTMLYFHPQNSVCRLKTL